MQVIILKWQVGDKPGGKLVQIGRRLREARDDRAHGGLGKFSRRAVVGLRPQLHLDLTSVDERGPCGRSRLSFIRLYVVILTYYKARGRADPGGGVQP